MEICEVRSRDPCSHPVQMGLFPHPAEDYGSRLEKLSQGAYGIIRSNGHTIKGDGPSHVGQ